jgi:hypothetical protein
MWLLEETMCVGFSYVFFALGFLWLLAEVKRNVGARYAGFPSFAIHLILRYTPQRGWLCLFESKENSLYVA